MPLESSVYSVSSSGKQRSFNLVKIFRLLVILLIIYLLALRFLPTTWNIKSDSMSPSLTGGSKLLITPYMWQPLKRGDIILIEPPYVSNIHWYEKLLDNIVRFYSFQNFNIAKKQMIIKRIVGLPGDTIRISNSVAEIKTPTANMFKNEFDLIENNYLLKIDPLPHGWQSDFPMAGNMKDMILEKNQYFLLGDNRMKSSDSRHWGPVNESSIQGRVIFTYWPFSAFGKLN